VSGENGDAMADARAALGIDRLVFGIHDASFPAEPEEDLGCGSPGSLGAERLLGRLRALGFDGIQLGPEGQRSGDDPSPYNAGWFSRDESTIPPARLSQESRARLLAEGRVRALAAERVGPPDRVCHREASQLQRRAIDLAYAAFQERASAPELRALRDRLDALAARHAGWLTRLERFEALQREEPGACDRWRFGQLLAHAEHEALRARAARLGLALYGDAQIGCAAPDRWAHRELFLAGFRMGAPPSRTNPDGQPWDYPVFDPALVEGRGPAFRLLAERMDKLFSEYDAVRIDHPHGYVCPWVYRAEGDDRGAALRRGTRLRASPDLPDYPELSRYAIPEPAQLSRDPDTRRFDDEWVAELRPEQVERYGLLFEAIVEAARRHRRGTEAIVCEVLSTQPAPLRRVLERHGIGRFRVTQKADVANPSDVYRVENSAPADWVMVGNHDTPPIWRLATEWARDGRAPAQALHLAARLEPDPARRAALASRLAGDPCLLAQAKLAELFLGPARSVYVFFTDAFGLHESYNVPGSISESNWSLRLAADWETDLRARLARDAALNLPQALLMALRARGLAAGRAPLAEKLGQLAAALRGSRPPLL
jgi:4-alpha-glucanotransferase